MLKNIHHATFLLLLLIGGTSTLASTPAPSTVTKQTATAPTPLGYRVFAGFYLPSILGACFWLNKTLYTGCYTEEKLKNEALFTVIAVNIFGSLMSVASFATLVGKANDLDNFCHKNLRTSLDKILMAGNLLFLIAFWLIANKIFYEDGYTKKKDNRWYLIAFHLCMTLTFGVLCKRLLTRTVPTHK